jgi:hypothetical protein
MRRLLPKVPNQNVSRRRRRSWRTILARDADGDEKTGVDGILKRFARLVSII